MRTWLGAIGIGLFLLWGSVMLLHGQRMDQPSSPYAKWKKGPPKDPNFFPIGVWLQNPKNAERFKQAGFNLYIGLWQGPTEEQLELLRKAGMPVICDQNAVGLRHLDDPIIVGWLQPDEPDNAQEIGKDAQGNPIYGGPIPPKEIIERYERMKKNDPDRPVYLGLGQGVANDRWIGHGTGFHPDHYYLYVKGGDIISYDVYPVAGLNDENLLWYVAKGLDRLYSWTRWNKSTDGDKIIWNVIECTRISNLERKPTPQQVKAEVWMSLVHGARGIVYFVHQFQPRFIEAALLEDPEMLSAVKAINEQIKELAPVLNSPSLSEDVLEIRSSNRDVPVHAMVKKYGNAFYLFVVGMSNAPTTATFQLKGISGKKAEVLGENRTIDIVKGRFQDAFRPYDVHLYKIK